VLDRRALRFEPLASLNRYPAGRSGKRLDLAPISRWCGPGGRPDSSAACVSKTLPCQRRVAERHHAEHEVHYVARDLAIWSAEHIARIADAAEAQDVEFSGDAAKPSGAAQRLRAVESTLSGRRPEQGTLLLGPSG
jgi:hypothetical protein